MLEAVAAADERHWRARFHLGLIAAQWGMHEDAAELLQQVRAAAADVGAFFMGVWAKLWVRPRGPRRGRARAPPPAQRADPPTPLPAAASPPLRTPPLQPTPLAIF